MIKCLSCTIAFLVLVLLVEPVFAGDPNVESVQTRLSKLGYELGSADGVMGPRTKAALRSFQAEEEIAITGEVDCETLAALAIEPKGVMANCGTEDASGNQDVPIPDTETASYDYEGKSCTEILDDWTISGLDAISSALHMSKTTVRALGFNETSTTIAAPDGCKMIMKGVQVTPYCDGEPLTEESCSSP